MTDNTDKQNRTSRSADTRAEKVARKPWSPPSKLDAPVAPEGYTNRWIRAETVGVEDRGNISDRLSEGFELVRFEELDESDKRKYTSMEDGQGGPTEVRHELHRLHFDYDTGGYIYATPPARLTWPSVMA